MPIQYKLDFAVERNDSVVAFCEVKVRKYSMEDIDSMGGYKISLAKWMAGMQMLKETGHPFVILVGATDGIFQKTVKHPPKLPLNIAVWGRDDRGDNQDFEPCVIIDAKEFKQI